MQLGGSGSGIPWSLLAVYAAVPFTGLALGIAGIVGGIRRRAFGTNVLAVTGILLNTGILALFIPVAIQLLGWVLGWEET
jgi:hypothetical protein